MALVPALPDLRNLFSGCLYSKDGFETLIFIPCLFVVYIAIWTQPGQNR